MSTESLHLIANPRSAPPRMTNRLGRRILALVTISFLAGHPIQCGESKNEKPKDKKGPAGLILETPQPHINYIFPAGGARGSSVEVSIFGTGLSGVTGARITGSGVATQISKSSSNTSNDTTCKFTIQISSSAETGEHDLRVISPGGASNRFRFFVGDMPEINELEPNSEMAQAQPVAALPVLINGQIYEKDRDYFRFRARKGECIVFDLQARQILPYIADAVPGWFDACLTLYDSEGHALATDDDLYSRPDPMLSYTFNKDGEYIIEVRDIIYRGRGDFVYRLSIGHLPFVSHLFPLGGKKGQSVRTELHGINLASTTANIALPKDSPALRVYQPVSNDASRTFAFAAGDAPEFLEKEPNGTFANANAVTLPVAINGRIDAPGDADYFSFDAKKGDKFVFEIFARRLGSPLDSMLSLFNSKGVLLASNDDNPDSNDALLTHHADSRLMHTIPADGRYCVTVRDTQGRGGEEFAYRLLIAPPQPDFALRFTPDNARIFKGDTAMLVVNATRKDGFQDAIPLTVGNLPNGYVVSKTVIAQGQDEAMLTITAPPNAEALVVSPVVFGCVLPGEKNALKISRQAVPAELCTQAFFTTHSVPVKECLMTVLDSPAFTLGVDLQPGQVLEAKPGEELKIVVKARRRGDIKGNIAIMMAQSGQKSKTPQSVTAKYTPIPPDKEMAEVVLTVAQTAKPGRHEVVLSGTLRNGKDNVIHYVPSITVMVAEPAKNPPKKNAQPNQISAKE